MPGISGGCAAWLLVWRGGAARSEVCSGATCGVAAKGYDFGEDVGEYWRVDVLEEEDGHEDEREGVERPCTPISYE